MAGDTVSHDVADLSAAAAGRERVAWSERSMPVLAGLRRRFAAELPLQGMRVAACLHVTAETAVLVRTLRAGGAEVALCAANPLSTQDDVAAALVVDDGVAVHARRGVADVDYRNHITAVLDIRPHLVLDDGSDLLEALHGDRPDLLAGVLAGCEATATGVLRLRRMAGSGALRLPVVALDSTEVKRLLDNRHGTGQSTLDAIIRATNTLIAGRTVVVAGYGAAGQGVAARAAGLGASVVVTEIEPTRALDAALAGHRVLPMTEAARLGDVFVTVTGNRDVLRTEHFAVLRDGAVLANSGHFDVEIDVAALAGAAVRRRRVRPHVEEYTLPDGRRLLLLAEGRVVNLAAADGNPPEVMDLAFAEQALTVEWLAGAAVALPAGVHAVPEHVDRAAAALKLAAMDVRLDTPTPAQRAYLSAWEAVATGPPGRLDRTDEEAAS